MNIQNVIKELSFILNDTVSHREKKALDTLQRMKCNEPAEYVAVFEFMLQMYTMSHYSVQEGRSTSPLSELYWKLLGIACRNMVVHDDKNLTHTRQVMKRRGDTEIGELIGETALTCRKVNLFKRNSL